MNVSRAYSAVVTSLVLGIAMAAATAVHAQDPKSPPAGAKADVKQPSAIVDGAKNAREEKIDPYQARFNRKRPVIAVLCYNKGTQINDFGVPYGILARADVADVFVVSPDPGTINLRPLEIQTQLTIKDFDKRFPDGSDYLIVPAFSNSTDAAIGSFIVDQSKKGGTVVSICVGADAVASTGLLDGRRATSHFGGEEQRLVKFPKVKWEKNTRYVADGKFVSSAGVSASIPTSLALVAAIADHDKASAVAKEIGVSGWTSKHDSDQFKARPGLPAPNYKQDNPSAKSVGVPVSPGIDEIALTLTLDAYSHTGYTKAFTVSKSKDPVKTRNGLVVLPAKTTDDRLDEVLPPLKDDQPAKALDKALNDIEKAYGRPAAYRIARFLEYPGFREQDDSGKK